MDNTKNKLQDVANLLIAQLERLNDDEVCIDTESTKLEVEKAEAMCRLSDAVVNIGAIQLKAIEVSEKNNFSLAEMPRLLMADIKKN